MGAVFRWIKYIYEWCRDFMIGGLDAYLKGVLGYPVQYHVSKTGNDSNNGLSWSNAFLTIQAGLDAVGALAGRAKGVVLVGPGGYSENLITPLDTVAPFGQLKAVNPTKQSRGAVWLSSPVATSPILTVRARGWLIDGFEFDSPTTDGCILLDGATANADAKFTEIANCLFNGVFSANDFGIDANEASPLVVIRDCTFFAFDGAAITTTDIYALQWEIVRCNFWNNGNHIAPKNSKGFDGAWIHDCNFDQTRPAVISIDMRGGHLNHIGPNNFLGGAYSNAGGYWAAGNDHWFGNACDAAHQATNPA